MGSALSVLLGVLPALARPLVLPAPAVGPPVRWAAAPLQLTVRPATECGLVLVLPFRVFESGWVQLPLAGPELVLSSASLDGRPVRLAGHNQGIALIARLEQGDHTLRAEGTAACGGNRLSLGTPAPAPVHVVVTAPELAWTVPGVHTAPGQWEVTSGPSLDLSWAPPREASERPRQIHYDHAVALRVGDDGIEGRAVLHQVVSYGTVNEVVFSVPGGVETLTASGPGVVGATVLGERVVVALSEAVAGVITVNLHFRAAAPGEDQTAAPVPRPLLGRGESHIVLVRGDDAVLLPDPGADLDAVSMRDVPLAARGLVPGEPLVSYRVAAGRTVALGLRQLRFTPVDQPPTFIDDARYTVVHTTHGRAWMRASWQVRNDRNPFLAVDVPAGWQVFGLRVAGQTAEPVRDADGRLLIPLEKSVETLDGLVAFPVELMLVGADAVWSSRGVRALSTPAVDAPIAVARWDLRLPQDVDPRDVIGRPKVVASWTSGDQTLLIGRGVKARSEPALPVSDGDGEQLSQEYWNQAYTAYKANAFDEAGRLLQRSLDANPDNPSAQSLRDNVFMLQGRSAPGEDQTMASNRVRAFAKAKSGGAVLEQAAQEVVLEQALRRGDDAAAAEAAGVLLSLTETLAAVEQDEAVEQKGRLSGYRTQLEELEKRVVIDKKSVDRNAPVPSQAPRLSRARGPVTSAAAPPPPPVVTRSATEIDFDGIDVAGELVKPEGALVLERAKAEFAPLVQLRVDMNDEIAETEVVDSFAWSLDGANVDNAESGDLDDLDGGEISGYAYGGIAVGGHGMGVVGTGGGQSAPGVGRRDPVHDPVPLAFPVDPPAPAPPLRRPSEAPAFPHNDAIEGIPRRVMAAAAWPRRPAPPPPTPFGLAVPTTIEASTLSLSLPESGTRLLLEQRVVPADEPLSLDLRYRPARTPRVP